MVHRFIETLSDPNLHGGIPRDDIPEVLGLLEGLKARLYLRLAAPHGTAPESAGNQLIKVEQAAERISLTPEYLYDLIRRKRFPAVKIGKYVLVDPKDIAPWIDAHREKGLDKILSSMYSPPHDRRRAQKDPKTDGAYASRVCGPRRHPLEQHRPPRARRGRNSGNSGQTGPADCGTARRQRHGNAGGRSWQS